MSSQLSKLHLEDVLPHRKQGGFSFFLHIFCLRKSPQKSFHEDSMQVAPCKQTSFLVETTQLWAIDAVQQESKRIYPPEELTYLPSQKKSHRFLESMMIFATSLEGISPLGGAYRGGHHWSLCFPQLSQGHRY